MRLRFAPSPTGYLHIGNARTAVVNYVIARKFNAAYVLRIEDTDMERSSAESERSILEDLSWLGIRWDEGPGAGGEYGPYRQSERFDIYRDYTRRLLENGSAYHCYCSPEELEAMRREAQAAGRSFVYPGRCRNLSEAEKRRLESEGRSPTVRFHVPEGRSIEVDDLIKGRVLFGSENIGGDFIIVRSDGVPMYNYIVIIDDALMKISHVIRGEDHLTNTPKQIMIARALDLPVPQYAHLALVLGPDRSKLSKRHGITSVEMYRREGYLPEALVNYLSMLGWATESGAEIMPVEEIARQIEIGGLARSAAVFDFQKLRWMNGVYIRDYPLDRIIGLFKPHLAGAGYEGIEASQLARVIELVRGNCEVLSDVLKYARIFLDETVEPDGDAAKLLAEEDSKKVIAAAGGLELSSIENERLAAALVDEIKSKTGFKGKKLFMPLRAALTGTLSGPELDKAIPLIGAERCMKRIRRAAGAS